MVFNFTANKIYGYDAENSREKLSENYTRILNSFISLPLNIPGTSFHQCMQVNRGVPQTSLEVFILISTHQELGFIDNMSFF